MIQRVMVTKLRSERDQADLSKVTEWPTWDRKKSRLMLKSSWGLNCWTLASLLLKLVMET